MEVLKPPLLRIGKRCYRKNLFLSQADLQQPGWEEKTNVAEEEESVVSCNTTYLDEECTLDADITATNNGFKASVPVPSAFFGKIIGPKGQKKNQIEKETKTKITIPKFGQEGDIVISSAERQGVASARSRIMLIVASCRQKQAFTHFLSLSFAVPEVKNRFIEFKSEVLKKCAMDRGVEESIFQNPDKLHLTIGTLVLLSRDEVQQAIELLNQCQQDTIRPMLEGKPLNAHLIGIEYMNDDPSEVDVLYAKVELEDHSDRLQVMANRLMDKFVASGLMQQQYERVKLHVTIINSLMRKDPRADEPLKLERKPRESFDARNVIKLFGKYDFGRCSINTLHMSIRFSIGKDGYYESAAKVQLNH